MQGLRSGRAGEVNEDMAAGVLVLPTHRPPNEWPTPAGLVEHPLACACCGVSTQHEDAAGHYEIARGWRGVFHPARVCRACLGLVEPSAASRADAVADLIDPADLAALAVAAWVPWFSEQRDSTPWQPGTAERWQHVDRSELARVVADHHARFGVTRSPNGAGCGGCGVAEAAGWRSTIYSRTGQRHYACGDCAEIVEVVGTGFTLDERLAVVAADLTREPFHRFAESISFQTYADAVPGGPGVEQPFGYLGADLVRLRVMVRERWPELVVGADVTAILERRAQARRGAAAAAASGGLRLDGGL